MSASEGAVITYEVQVGLQGLDPCLLTYPNEGGEDKRQDKKQFTGRTPPRQEASRVVFDSARSLTNHGLGT